MQNYERVEDVETSRAGERAGGTGQLHLRIALVSPSSEKDRSQGKGGASDLPWKLALRISQMFFGHSSTHMLLLSTCQLDLFH